MIIELAQGKEKQIIAKLDSHIPSPRLGECIWNGQVYVLKDDSIKNGGQNHRVKDPVVGVLRYSLSFQDFFSSFKASISLWTLVKEFQSQKG